MSAWSKLLAQGRDVTAAAVGYLVPLTGSVDRLEAMDLPHSTPPPRPPTGNGFRQAVRAVGSERGTLQIEAGGRGIVARMMAAKMETTTYREHRSDQIAHRRAAAGRTPAKSIRRPQWLFAGDNAAKVRAATPPTSMADAIGPCLDCK